MNLALRRRVRIAANNRCDYCRLPSGLVRLPFQLDHIIAEQHGGPTIFENLAWSCLNCNKRKGPNLAGIDPLTGKLAAFFHPRRQRWDRHFYWNSALLAGKTQVGRATIVVLAINAPLFVGLRAALLDEGVFF